ncbi:MAG: ribonuclease HIII [candidate division Zixibacteria bacterium]|nr:ribonuclease HIII [candidate division Zixibacteria bacterium]
MLIKYVITTEEKDETRLNLYLKKNGTSSSILLEKGSEKIIEGLIVSVNKGNHSEPRIGIDEAGKGDYFGPLVVCAAGVTPETEIKLKLAGVTDSKSLSDDSVKAIANKIKKLCIYDVVVIGPGKYNELYAKFKNLNKLLAWGHARALENVLKKGDFRYAISDKFSLKDELRRSLFSKGQQIELVERHRAESDTAVAAASIIARAEFLMKLNNLSKESVVVLPKGCSEAVNDAGKQLVKKLGENKLGDYAKLHFKTTSKVLELKGSDE